MSRVLTNGVPRTHAPAPQYSVNAGGLKDGHDERSSLSGSEDGSYAQYPDTLKGETDNEDDNGTLISQTLNSDGTPKRPMNAFMIFARRRRPQVSAENQAMRTGEVSKILSREWSSMPAAEKQFYQDQARQLKEWFNTKYPDYVYRRRPNHSRRPRRKPDAPPDNFTPQDSVDDLGFEDAAESPPDGEDPPGSDVMGDIRSSPDLRPYGDQVKVHSTSSRATAYAYPVLEHPLRSRGRHENLPPFSSANGDRFTHGSPPISSPHMSASLQYPPIPRRHSTSMYSTGSNGHDDSWGRPPVRPTGWMGNDSDRSNSTLSEPKVHQPVTNWHRPSPGGLSSSPPNTAYVLPTLNTPFFPDQSQQGSSQAMSPTSYGSNEMESTLLGARPYSDHAVSMPPPTNSYQSVPGREGYFYRPSQTLPSISSYAQGQPSATGLKGYW